VVVATGVRVVVFVEHGQSTLSELPCEVVDLFTRVGVKDGMVQSGRITVKVRLAVFSRRFDDEIYRAEFPRCASLSLLVHFVSQFTEKSVGEFDCSVEVCGVEFDVVE
jgi:hypothetical protein